MHRVPRLQGRWLGLRDRLYRGSIGIVETRGRVGSTEAADAMCKCAQVELVGCEDVGGGHHAVCVRGDLGSVSAALEQGARAARAVGTVLGVLLLPRPHEALDVLLADFRAITPMLPTPEHLRRLNVHELRALARDYATFPIKGRAISRANRDELVGAFEKLIADSQAMIQRGRSAGKTDAPKV
ncbi:MAG: BMC domain-containing protein [Planctomycetota bacterium]